MIGKRIGPYEIVEEIGKGGMATVYRAYQPNLDRYVAIKIIHRAIALEAASLERFQREARLLTRLVHPHLLPIYDYDATHDPPYIVMRYLESGTLKDVIDKGRLPHPEIIHMLRQVASALDYAHRNNVIHRDIKPTNVMLDQDGNAFLTDFGIARTIEAGQDMTQSGYALGTPGYMSPEQGMGVDGLNGQADIYSLGVMTFQMLTGKLPYTGDTPLSIIFKHISDPIPDITQYDPSLAPMTTKVIERVMAKDPEARYATATDFVVELSQALDVSGVGTASILKRTAQAHMDAAALKREQKRVQIEATMEAFAVSRDPKKMGTQAMPDVPTTLTPTDQRVVVPSAMQPPVTKAATSRWPLIAGAVTVVAIIALVLIALRDNLTSSVIATQTALVAFAQTETARPTVTPTLTLTATITASHTPTATFTASHTPTVTNSPTASATPTVSTPDARALRSTIVRLGPGSQYPKVADLTPDMRLIIIGASEDGAWLKVLLPDQSEGWVAYNPATFDFQGNIQGVPLASAPTDTPSYTPTATLTFTATATATASHTPTLTSTATFTLTPSATVTPSATPTVTPSLTLSPTVEVSNGSTLTPTLMPTPTATPAGRLPFVADFEGADALNGWDYDSAAWQVVNEGGEGVLIGQGKLTQPIVVLGREQPEWQAKGSGNLVIGFNINLDKQSGGARVIFRCADLNGCQKGYNALEILPGLMILRRNGETPDIMNREGERLLRQVKVGIDEQQWYEVRIWVDGSRILVYVDRQLIMSVEDLITPQLGGGAVILQTNSAFRAVRWDNLVIQRPESASNHFQTAGLPVTWQTTSPTAAFIGTDDTGNQYLQIQDNVTVKPSILPIRDLSLSCRVWVEQGGYQLSIRQGASGSLRFTFAAGNTLIEHLDGAGGVVFSRDVANVYSRNRWDDLSISFIGDRLQVYRDGVNYYEGTIAGSPASGGISFQTQRGDVIRLDDCLITETAASSNASARFALELQQQVFARPFREPRSDISDAFDDKFRTDVYWVNGLQASGEFIVENNASDHQKFLRLANDNQLTFRLIRSDLAVQLFGAGADTRNFSDTSDYLVSVDLRLPQAISSAWMAVRATPSLGGSAVNGYKLGLRRNPDGSISTIVSYQDGNRDETYFEGVISGAGNNLPEWVTLTAITYKQRIAFFVDGHFIMAIDPALALGGTVALGVDAGTTADFDSLIIRDTTPFDE